MADIIHIYFLVNWDSEEQLLKGWNQIDSFVAVNIQSQTELLIERSNFYIIHFVKKTVMKEIKREIEYNPFCAKKYVYDNFQEDLYVERNYVEEKSISSCSIRSHRIRK